MHACMSCHFCRMCLPVGDALLGSLQIGFAAWDFLWAVCLVPLISGMLHWDLQTDTGDREQQVQGCGPRTLLKDQR